MRSGIGLSVIKEGCQGHWDPLMVLKRPLRSQTYVAHLLDVDIEAFVLNVHGPARDVFLTLGSAPSIAGGWSVRRRRGVSRGHRLVATAICVLGKRQECSQPKGVRKGTKWTVFWEQRQDPRTKHHEGNHPAWLGMAARKASWLFNNCELYSFVSG
jgi:hypothetical protein